MTPDDLSDDPFGFGKVVSSRLDLQLPEVRVEGGNPLHDLINAHRSPSDLAAQRHNETLAILRAILETLQRIETAVKPT